MRSGEVLMENPSEIHEEKQENYIGQKAEGFEKEGEFPKSITVNGGTFERGFVQEKTGNIFYTRTKEDTSMQDMLLLDKQGVILKHIDQTERTSEEQAIRNQKIEKERIANLSKQTIVEKEEEK